MGSLSSRDVKQVYYGDTTILNFRHLWEKYQLAAGIPETIDNYLLVKGLSLRQGTIVDTTLI
ncbi:hypothetical protein D3C80_1966770 [compost metagenome]